jgi:hypothetical protein
MIKPLLFLIFSRYTVILACYILVLGHRSLDLDIDQSDLLLERRYQFLKSLPIVSSIYFSSYGSLSSSVSIKNCFLKNSSCRFSQWPISKRVLGNSSCGQNDTNACLQTLFVILDYVRTRKVLLPEVSLSSGIPVLAHHLV